jgi:hypothetical protein
MSRNKRNKRNQKARKRRPGQPPSVSQAAQGKASAAKVETQLAAAGPTNPGGNSYQQAGAPLLGGRQTQPTNVNPLGLLSYAFIARRQFQDLDLTDLTANRSFNAQQLLELCADISPEVGLALSNTLRLVNGGWKYQVKTLTGTRELKQGKAALDGLIARVNKDSGGIDALIDSWSITAFLQGAIAGEIAPTDDLQDIEDIYAVQPWTIFFSRDEDQKLVPYQQQVMFMAGNQGYGLAGWPYKRLNPTTFGYMPIDAPPDDPYGRAPAGPVLQMIAFDLGLLRDIRQAVHTNAWGRLQIKLIEELVIKNAPTSIRNDQIGDKKIAFIKDRLTEFRNSFNNLKPDDAFFTTDAIELTPVDFSGRTFQIEAIVRLLERRLIRALKQLPVLMGSNEGTTETHGTVQMDIYAANIKSLQRKIANLLNKLLGVALQIYGIAGKVEWEFDAPRANDRLKDVQADMAEAQLLVYYRDQGWITQDDASIQATGSKAVGPVPPRPTQVLPEPKEEKSPSDTSDEEDKKKKKPADDPAPDQADREDKEAA